MLGEVSNFYKIDSFSNKTQILMKNKNQNQSYLYLNKPSLKDEIVAELWPKELEIWQKWNKIKKERHKNEVKKHFLIKKTTKSVTF